MSETNSESCGSQAVDPVLPGVPLPGSSSDSPDCSFGSPLQGPGGPQRDERELAPCDVEEFETVCHPPGIEDEIAEASAQLCASGAVVDVQLETRGITSQKTKSFQRELWCRQTVHKNTVAAKLREHGRIHEADGLEACHTETTWCVCKGCNASRPFLNRCERFYCPECQPTLSRDRERSVGWWAREMSQPKHVILTLKNFPRINKRVVQWAKAAFGKLRRRRFARNWVGGFYNWEVTNEGKGWHLHVHALVEAKWIDSGQLSTEWMKVTRGLGRIVKVKDARQHDYLKEVTKYAVKGSQLAAFSGEQIAMFIDAFTGVRTFGVFGSLYAKRTEFREWLKTVTDTHLKCKCGCTDFWYQTDFEHEHGELVPLTSARPPTVADISQLSLKLA